MNDGQPTGNVLIGVVGGVPCDNIVLETMSRLAEKGVQFRKVSESRK